MYGPKKPLIDSDSTLKILYRHGFSIYEMAYHLGERPPSIKNKVAVLKDEGVEKDLAPSPVLILKQEGTISRKEVPDKEGRYSIQLRAPNSKLTFCQQGALRLMYQHGVAPSQAAEFFSVTKPAVCKRYANFATEGLKQDMVKTIPEVIETSQGRS